MRMLLPSPPAPPSTSPSGPAARAPAALSAHGTGAAGRAAGGCACAHPPPVRSRVRRRGKGRGTRRPRLPLRLRLEHAGRGVASPRHVGRRAHARRGVPERARKRPSAAAGALRVFGSLRLRHRDGVVHFSRRSDARARQRHHGGGGGGRDRHVLRGRGRRCACRRAETHVLVKYLRAVRRSGAVEDSRLGAGPGLGGRGAGAWPGRGAGLVHVFALWNE